jgi:hypothetical protein
MGAKSSKCSGMGVPDDQIAAIIAQIEAALGGSNDGGEG